MPTQTIETTNPFGRLILQRKFARLRGVTDCCASNDCFFFFFFFLRPLAVLFWGACRCLFPFFNNFVKTLKKMRKQILWQFHVECTKRLLIDFAACFIMFLTLLCVKELLLCENILLKTNINKKHAAEENLKLISNYI